MTAALIFVAVKYIMKGNVTFHDVIGRFGSCNSIALAFMVISFILSIPGFYSLQLLLVNLLRAILAITIFTTIYSYRSEAVKKIDPIYAALAVWGIVLLVSMIFLDEIAFLTFL